MIDILGYFALTFIAGYFCYAVFGCFRNSYWNKLDYCFLLIFFFSVIFLSFYIVPSISDDLYRWHAAVNWYRLGRPDSFSLTVRRNSEIVCFLNTFIVMLVSKLSNNGWLQVIWLTINYCCMYRIMQILIKEKARRGYFYIGILLAFAFTPYFFQASGLRFPSVCFIMLYTIMMSIKKGKKSAPFIVGTACVFIHVGALIILLIWGAYCVSKETKIYRLIVLWSIFLDSVIYILRKIPISFASVLSNKLYYYVNHYQSSLDIRYWLLCFFSIILFGSGLYITKNRILSDDNAVHYAKYLECLLLFTVGSIANCMFFARCMQLLGVSLIPYNYYIVKQLKHKLPLIICELFVSLSMIMIFLVSVKTFFSYSIFDL